MPSTLMPRRPSPSSKQRLWAKIRRRMGRRLPPLRVVHLPQRPIRARAISPVPPLPPRVPAQDRLARRLPLPWLRTTEQCQRTWGAQLVCFSLLHCSLSLCSKFGLEGNGRTETFVIFIVAKPTSLRSLEHVPLDDGPRVPFITVMLFGRHISQLAMMWC